MIRDQADCCSTLPIHLKGAYPNAPIKFSKTLPAPEALNRWSSSCRFLEFSNVSRCCKRETTIILQVLHVLDLAFGPTRSGEKNNAISFSLERINLMRAVTVK